MVLARTLEKSPSMKALFGSFRYRTSGYPMSNSHTMKRPRLLSGLRADDAAEKQSNHL